ncbi:MAG: thiamine-phosphate kinase [Rhodospirillaceae bacterium]|nr:thiamine-phosphate kinase [Rhodospirillaceae bacterium]
MNRDGETGSLDEFGVIERYFARKSEDSSVIVGVGDDAAVVEIHGATAVATDTLVSGVHFPDGLAGDAVGHRVLAVNLSDLAAMGAEPRWCMLALTMPDADHAWLEAFARGFFALAGEHGVELVGGDTTRGPLSVTLQVLGEIDGDCILTRGGASAGDDIHVTGTLGDAAGGLDLLSRSLSRAGPAHRVLVSRFLAPKPRIAAGIALRGLASAAIDVSDGLLADLGHLCRASGRAACVDVDRLPVSRELQELFPARNAESWALTGGDDYELCFTAPPSRRRAIQRALAACETPVRRIGQLEEGSGVHCRRNGRPMAPPVTSGYLHFGESVAAPGTARTCDGE